jgi:ERI1 exoribonuclease 2
MYYIVIDFESTCWKDKRGLNPSPEIIEFPAVLYDAKRRTIPEGSHFQQYVMPTEQPVLSNFCTELTGITQDKVDAGSLSFVFC